MLFCIFLIGLGIGIVLTILYNIGRNTDDKCQFFYLDIIGGIATLCLTIFSIASGTSIILYITDQCSKDAILEQHKETYSAIMYKIESEQVKDDFNLLSKEIIDEVQAYNESYSRTKEYNKNFWIGIFNSDTYEGLEKIDYSLYKR